MATVVRKICGYDTKVSQKGVNRPDSRLSAEYPWMQDAAVFDYNQRLTALPAALEELNATYTRNSVKNVEQNGALVALTANQFGTSYDDVTGLYGYVPEPAATNLATNSDGNAATYTSANIVDGTAVSGFTNGIAFGDNSVGRYAYKQLTLTAATAYTCSFFIIMDDGGVPVVGNTNTTGDLSVICDNNISPTNITVRHIGGSLYRVSGSIASATGGATRNCGAVKYTGQSARTFRTTQIQVETGLRATSYIATAGSTVARAADVLTVPLANITGFNGAGYTLYCDQRMDTTLTASVVAVELSDGTITNRVLVLAGSGINASMQSTSGGVTQVNPSLASLGLTRKKYAASFMLNSAKFALAGVAGTEDTSCLMPVGLTTLHLGQSYSGSIPYNGFVFADALITQPITQAQLNGLTT